MKTSLFLRKTIFIASLFSVVILSGCLDSKNIEPQDILEKGMTLPEMNYTSQTLEDIAGGMSLFAQDAEVGTFLKKEALKQFDGDYDVLYKHVKDHQFSDGQTFESKFAENYAAFTSLSVEEAKTQIQEITEVLPLLNISIPLNIESWDPDAEIIPVTFTPIIEQGKAETFTHVKAFSENGETQFISVSEEPNFPVMVIGLNERCDEDGTVREKFLPQEDPGQGSPIESFSTGQELKLWQVNVPNLNEWESWLYGKPEFIMTVAGGLATGTNNGVSYLLKQWTLPGNRSDYNDPASWHVINDLIFPSWDNDLPGRLITVNVGEEDGGLPVDVEFDLFKIKVKKSNWPVELEFTFGTVYLGNIGANHKDLGTIAIDRNSYACWTDFYTNSVSHKHFRFYLTCP